MRSPSLPSSFCALVLTLSLGCAAGAADTAPGGPGGGTDPTSYATLADFCTARAKAECGDVVVKACGSKTTTACLAARNSACNDSAPQGTTYQAQNAPACITAVKSAYADAMLTDVEIADLGTTCGTKIFSGPGAARAPCTSDYDCSSAAG